MHKGKDKDGHLSVYRYMMGSDDTPSEMRKSKSWEHVGHVKDAGEIPGFIKKFNEKKKFGKTGEIHHMGEHYHKQFVPKGHTAYQDDNNEQLFAHAGSHKDKTPRGAKKWDKKDDEQFMDGDE